MTGVEPVPLDLQSSVLTTYTTLSIASVIFFFPLDNQPPNSLPKQVELVCVARDNQRVHNGSSIAGVCYLLCQIFQMCVSATGADGDTGADW